MNYINDEFRKLAERTIKAFNEFRKAFEKPIVKTKYPHYKPLYKKTINGGWKKRFKGVEL